MSQEYSILRNFMERVRSLVDSPDSDGKYTDDWLLSHVVQPSIQDVYSRMMLGALNPVVLPFLLELEEGRIHYPLPGNLQEIVAIVRLSDSGMAVRDWRPSSRLSPHGPGWVVEGRNLAVIPAPNASAEPWIVWFIPSANASWFVGNARVDEEGSNVVLKEEVLGKKDRREGVYVGHEMRVLSDQGTIKTHTVSANDPSGSSNDGTISVRAVLPETPPLETFLIEVLPVLFDDWSEAAATRCAIKLGSISGVTRHRRENLEMEHRRAMKTALDLVSSIQSRSLPARWRSEMGDPLMSPNPDRSN